MVVTGSASDLNLLQSSNKVSLLTRDQTYGPEEGIIMWSMNRKIQKNALGLDLPL